MDNYQEKNDYKIAIVDDHHIVRSGLTAIVNALDKYTVVFEASNGEELINYLRVSENPDLVIIDLHMPIMDGFQTLEYLSKHHPDIRSLALTVDASEDSLIKAIRSGARGFIRKNARPVLFKAAIDSIVHTGYFHNEDIHNTYIKNPEMRTREERRRQEVIQKITPRELEFLRLVCRRDEPTYDNIADAMGISRRTVDYYRQELFDKFEIKSKVGLVLFAVEYRLLDD